MQKLLLHFKRFYAAYAFALLTSVMLGVLIAQSVAQPTIPTRMFDVRNGNGVVDTGVTYPQAIVIVFKDKASKDEFIDAVATQYKYQATIPDPANPGSAIANPVSKAAFANKQITAYCRDIVSAASAASAVDAARKTATDAAEAKLPINR